MARLRKIVGGAGRLWRSLNIWTKAFVLWTVVSSSIYWVVMDIHASSPGPYRAPQKVAVRKAISAVRGTGSVVLFGLALFTTAYKERERAREPEQT